MSVFFILVIRFGRQYLGIWPNAFERVLEMDSTSRDMNWTQ